MPLVTFHLDYRALGFAVEQAERCEIKSAEAYLQALLNGALNHEMAREKDAEDLPQLLPALVIHPRHVRGDDGRTRKIGIPPVDGDIPL
ncbi:hypothetical protein DEA8626_01439 [Defluviimonas aquaemixtae]|uniref:Uncharacterized protein n=1 Tax=Albidovulum aquaemixtae TaxID=1542388 RepID=A0A2R8B5I0_9RHOB|nr:hypothetical protein [Defluviimonas aquaemixtae]SPH17911.1 hypothetical protein DEA8626_01439 [Defluviimonas aquaemixtae]